MPVFLFELTGAAKNSKKGPIWRIFTDQKTTETAIFKLFMLILTSESGSEHQFSFKFMYDIKFSDRVKNSARKFNVVHGFEGKLML